MRCTPTTFDQTPLTNTCPISESSLLPSFVSPVARSVALNRRALPSFRTIIVYRDFYLLEWKRPLLYLLYLCLLR